MRARSAPTATARRRTMRFRCRAGSLERPADMVATFTPVSYSRLAVNSADELMFGVAPHPVRCGLGLEIGAGKVYPEVNFTLPPMNMTDGTWPEIRAHYEEIGREVVARAVPLQAPGLVLEFELLPLMTERPEWGAELTGILKKHMQ